MIDFTPIIQPALDVAATVLMAVASAYAPRAIKAYEDRTGITLTADQRKAVQDAAQTAAGVLETALDKGALGLSHIDVGSPAVQAQVQAVINRVPDAARALGVTADTVANMIVARVDTANRVEVGAAARTP